ncbi:MAG: InlB B-repeat-containing protein, partial [Clostridia bacterium]|nr:InlB B-repeat-containing protein [Clostridia bacterium]
MKKFYFKKALSVLMAVMMLLSCWVWVAPTKAEAASITDLKNIIEQYEGYLTNGTFYTNMVSNYTAYNNAKRYYDAVTYGGVAFDEALADQYVTALSNSFGATGANTTYIDYLNQQYYDRNGGGTNVPAAISKTYTKNLVYMDYDFSYSFQFAQQKWIDKNYLELSWSIPNMIVGITDSDTSTFPLHLFYYTSKTNRKLSYIYIENNSIKTNRTWRVAKSAIQTNNITTDSAAAYGKWVYDSDYRTNEDIGAESDSNAQNLSNNYLYSASTYYDADLASVKSFSSTFSTSANMVMMNTPIVARMDGSTMNKWASDYGYGYVYYVYMEPYKQNWSNWKTLLPKLSYANYDGYVYSNVITNGVASNLDTASSKDLSMSSNSIARTGDISSNVTSWINNATTGANALANAKSAATTTVTTKYNDLISAISSADSIYAGGSAPYTYASWNNFVSAYNAARAHMASLNPNGSNVQYSSDATTVGNLATALTNAKAALQYRTYDVTYENLFSFSSWANSASNAGNNTSTQYKGEVIADVNAGTITLDATLNDFYTLCNGAAGFYLSTVEPGETYIFDYDLTIESGGMQVGAWFYDDSGNAVTDTATGKAYSLSYSAPDYFEFTAPAGCTKVAFRIGATGDGAKCTYSNIALYKQTRADAVELDTWTSRPIRKVFTYNAALGTTLDVPAREGYTFNGWWVDTVNTNGTKDAGEEITDGNGTVVSALQNYGITQDWVLYSDWIINTYTVTFKNWDGSVLDTQTIQYKSGATAPADPTRAPDDTNHYTFNGWNTDFSSITTDKTVTATYTPTAHSKIYTIATAGAEDSNGNIIGTHSISCSGCSWTSSASCVMTEDAAGYVAPNCSTAGQRVYKCADCGNSYTKVIAATGVHNYADDGWYCVDETNHRRDCTNGDKNCTAYELSGHEYSDTDWEDDGETNHAHLCTVCKGDSSKKTEAHVFSDWAETKASTCTTAGEESRTCSKCNKTETRATALAEHTLGEWIVDTDATCITAGSQHKECANCDYEVTEAIPATGKHVYGEWTYYSPEEHQAKCTKDTNCTATVTEAHTPTEDAVQVGDSYHYYRCEKCDAYGALLNGVFKENLRENCYEVDAEYKEVDDNNHTVTCICGRVKTVSHNWTVTDTKAATCTEDGYKNSACSDCGATKEETLTKTGHNYTGAIKSDGDGKDATHSFLCVNGCETYGGAVKHTWNAGEVKEGDEATCEKAGTKTYTCQSDCGATYTEAIPATGHSFTGDPVPTTTTTHSFKCTNDGCDAVGTMDGETAKLNGVVDCDFTVKYEKKDADNHTAYCVCGNTRDEEHAWPENGVIDPDSTCTNEGTETFTCTKCSETKQEEVALKSHNLTKTEAVEATCTTDGNIDYWSCSVCNQLFSDENGTTVITQAETVVEKINHKNKEHHDKVPESCTADGTIEYWSCPDCKKNFSDEDCKNEVIDLTIEKTGHDYKDTVTEPTCEEQGYTTHTCDTCGYSYADSYVDAKGHDFSVNNDRIHALSDGKHNWKCSKCSDYGIVENDVQVKNGSVACS